MLHRVCAQILVPSPDACCHTIIAKLLQRNTLTIKNDSTYDLYLFIHEQQWLLYVIVTLILVA